MKDQVAKLGQIKSKYLKQKVVKIFQTAADSCQSIEVGSGIMNSLFKIINSSIAVVERLFIMVI